MNSTDAEAVQPDPGAEGAAPAPSGGAAPAPTRRAVLGAAAVALTAAACSAPDSGAGATGSASGAPSSPTGSSRAPSAPASGTASTSATGSTGLVRPRIASTPGDDIVNGPRDRSEVALTFHGQGPASLTRQVLAECASAGAHITVFAVGTWVQAAPELARAVLAGGHELGNHTWSHQQMKTLDAATAASEVARGVKALEQAVGTAGWWFRPSGTLHSTARIRDAARAAGYARCVSYDVDPQDFLDPGAAAVRQRTRAQVRAGSIVSLHLGHAGTVEALPGILTDLSRMGLRPVGLSTLLRDAA
ncbi:polysaccharide deacetylase family protein [Pedococcus sp. NPDC057267]|uniref:polysaccharide deacetylase family protein n=1 Tax=Pedococcus sp. NPDC057267 TaxID=3346077 RepID=UPI00363EC1CE